MPYTTVDLGPPIDEMFEDCITDREALLEKLKHEQDRTKLDKVDRSTIQHCVQKCESEIDRQVAIYVNEEKEYADTITKLHATAKQVSTDLIAELETLRNNFNEDTLISMTQKLRRLQQILEIQKRHSEDLTAHQGFRADPGWDTNQGVKAVGAEQEKALKTRFITKRAPGIAATAGLAPKIEKIKEFNVRAADCLKTAMALKSKTAGSIKELTAEAEKLRVDTENNAGSTKDSLTKINDMIKVLNQAAVQDAGKLKAAEQRLAATDLQIKNLKTYQKTLALVANNFPDKAKNVVQHPPQKEAQDMLKKLAEAHRWLKQMGEDLAKLVQSRENLSKLIVERNKPQKK